MLRFDRVRASSLSILLLTAVVMGLTGPVVAQAPPPSFDVPRTFDSGWLVNAGNQTSLIASIPVRVAGASWVRLVFSHIELPEAGAKLRITSVLDGAYQELDARQCREWGHASAYFNGEDVQVEIVAEPGAGRSRVVLAGVTAGVPPIPSYTQCGSADDRTPSTDPRLGRGMPIGCSTWMIDDCSHNFLTAGHCSGPTLQVIEFNVPLSNANGSVNHPSPADQYAVDATSKQSAAGTVGSDWGYFGVFPNPVTGLRPYQKQQATFQLAAAAPSTDRSILIRVTGYGVDTSPSQNNQVQQTSTGPYVQHSGTIVSYQTDTEGGNSGSPVIWDQQNLAIGIHTHGGCNTSGGNNNGTAIEHPDLQSALANPLGQCVCRGEASVYCTGKVNSQGCLEAISATGTPSASGGSFVIQGTQILSHKIGFLFYGRAPANTPFQGGTACVAAQLKRTPAQNSGGNPGPSDCSGLFSFDMGAHIASGADASLVLGANAFAQYYSRDPASPSGPYGLTNGLQFTIGP